MPPLPLLPTKTHVVAADTAAVMIPHLISHVVVRTNQVAVRTALESARYAARKVMSGGTIFWTSSRMVAMKLGQCRG